MMRYLLALVMNIRKLWIILSPPKTDPVILLLEQLVKNQDKQQLLMAEMVKEVVSTSGKQAEVLKSYLSLFQSNEAPETWTRNESEENLQKLMEDGFPVEGTEEQQAEWILKNM